LDPQVDVALTVSEILERTQWDFFWVPPDTEVVEREELLYVRCDRDAGYLNTCTRIRGAPGRLRALVAEVARAHATTLSTFAVPSHVASPALEAALVAEGYTPGPGHDAVALSVVDHVPRSSSSWQVRPVLDRPLLDQAIRVGERAFGRRSHQTEDEARSELERLVRPGTRVARFVAIDPRTGRGESSAGITAHPALRFGFLWGGGTVPEARGRGAYAAVLEARIAWARATGLDRVGLYARHGTSAPIVARMGFRCGGSMVQWLRRHGGVPGRGGLERVSRAR